MKFIFGIFLVFVGAKALTEEQKLKVDEHTKICAEEVGLEYESGVKYRFSVIEDNTDSAKKFVKCFFIRTGFMNEDGVLQKDVMLAKISLGKEDEAKAKISAVIENCTALSGETADETAFKVHNCYWGHILAAKAAAEKKDS